MFFSLAIHPQQPLQDWNIQYKLVGLPIEHFVESNSLSQLYFSIIFKLEVNNENKSEKLCGDARTDYFGSDPD